jgi:hypothetical protein
VKKRFRKQEAAEPIGDYMPRLRARDIGEVVAILGVVLSLLFVGLQLRQNALVSRASAYQELGIAMAEGWRFRASDRELNDLVYRAGSTDPDVWSNLTDSDIRRVRAYVLSFLRIYQSAYLEVQQGLLRPEALEDLGIDGLGDSRLLQNMWPFVRNQLSVEFAHHLASEMHLPEG